MMQEEVSYNLGSNTSQSLVMITETITSLLQDECRESFAGSGQEGGAATTASPPVPKPLKEEDDHLEEADAAASKMKKTPLQEKLSKHHHTNENFEKVLDSAAAAAAANPTKCGTTTTNEPQKPPPCSPKKDVESAASAGDGGTIILIKEKNGAMQYLKQPRTRGNHPPTSSKEGNKEVVNGKNQDDDQIKKNASRGNRPLVEAVGGGCQPLPTPQDPEKSAPGAFPVEGLIPEQARTQYQHDYYFSATDSDDDMSQQQGRLRDCQDGFVSIDVPDGHHDDYKEGEGGGENSKLTRAKPVPEDEEEQPINLDDVDVPKAEEFDEGKHRETMDRKHFATTVKWVAFGLVVIIVAVIISSVFVLSGTDESDTTVDTPPSVNEDQNVTLSPPTMAPTYSLEGYVMSLLPHETLQELLLDNDDNKQKTPQAKALDWLIADPSLVEYPDWRIIQRYVLATLFYSTDGYSWFDSDKWLSYSQHECDWFYTESMGIWERPYLVEDGMLYPRNTTACGSGAGEHQDDDDSQQQIQHLWLVQNGLHGTLPPQLGLLTSLKTITMYSNNLQGTIPSSLQSLTNLQKLALYGNSLEGSIPSELGLLSNSLEHLWIFSNRLGSSLPTELGRLSLLQFLLMDGNQLRGPIPSEIGSLSQLRRLWAWGSNAEGTYGNQLSGTIPTELGNLISMESMALDVNALTGTFPSELGRLSNMYSFHFEGMRLTGTLPTQVGLLTSLTSLIFPNTLLSGPLPTEMGALTLLDRLFLNDNDGLVGTIPSGFGDLTKLGALRIGNTSLSGSIPLSFCEQNGTWTEEGITLDCDMVECSCQICNCVR